MLKKILVSVSCLLLTICKAMPQPPSPEQFLGYEAGSRYTHYHEILSYFKRLDSTSDNLVLIQYGTTCEHRAQVIAVISSAGNISNLDLLRRENLSLAGMDESPANTSPKVIVWLSYNIHGNEPSSSEAAMETAWQLVNHKDKDHDNWLNNAIIIIDPCLNPDGRERYVSWFEQQSGEEPDPGIQSEEHHEPWPGGRVNHYYFDLNRDWAWVTQKETENRVKIFNEWLPQIHVDFHEQEINNPYYFAPAAKPYHEMITPWQRNFQQVIGENNAKHFDAHGWRYFTQQVYDLYYPGYGDTYPMFSGSVGMTYEVAGGERAGLQVILETGDTLTLKDRIMQHTTSGLSTIETAVNNEQALLDNFRNYYDFKNNGFKPKYRDYIIPVSNPTYKINKIKRLLEFHKIKYGYAEETKNYNAYDYNANKIVPVNIHIGDLVIPGLQPKEKLTEVLFEPQSRLEDSLTYDITAWSVPYAYGINAYGMNEDIKYTTIPPVEKNIHETSSGNMYAFAIPGEGLDAIRLMAVLLQSGLKIRTNILPVQFKNIRFARGSFFVMEADNRNQGETINQLYNRFNRIYPGQLVALISGMSTEGDDMGSKDFRYIKKPYIALLTGDDVYSGECGEIWYFMDHEIDFPVHRINTSYLKQSDLSRVDVLIIPSGNYNKYFDDDYLKSLNEWVAKGGRLILEGDALESFADKEKFGLKTYLNDSEKVMIQKMTLENSPWVTFENKERNDLKDVISGGIFRVSLDNSHPLAFGYPSFYYSLKQSNDRYAMLAKGFNVGVIKNSKSRVEGYAGSNTKSKLVNALEFGVENNNRGSVVYMVDDPLFRDFWEEGKMLFANALFMPW